MRRPTLNFVSGIATPPVNQLLAAVDAREDVDLRLWYAEETAVGLYGWKANPTHQIKRAEIYGTGLPHQGLLDLASRAGSDEGFMLVGWSNPTLRILIPLLASRGRRLAFFTDCPAQKDRAFHRELLREMYLGILRDNSTVFAIGKTAVDYYAARRFAPSALCNLLLPVELPSDLLLKISEKAAVRAKYGVEPRDLFVVTGSRLVREKGFDLMFEALAALAKAGSGPFKVLLVGTGVEQTALADQVKSAGLSNAVIFEPWMEFSDFCSCIAAADLVVHPARYDAFGGITLTATGLGVPVIGTRQAGSAVELIEHGVNGFLYDAEATRALTGHMHTLMQDRILLAQMAAAARRMAGRFTAESVADTLVNRLLLDGILAL